MFVGVFDDEPEIGFKVKNFKQAKALMIKYNQKSLWKNKAMEEFENKKHYNKNVNPMRGD